MSNVVMRDATRADLLAIVTMLADDFLGGDRGEVLSEPLPDSYVALVRRHQGRPAPAPHRG